jgi:hypothetical protein
MRVGPSTPAVRRRRQTIDKWISGEIEVFDPHQIALPGCDSNPQKESSSMQPFFRRFTHPAIAIGVVALGIGGLVGSVTII